MNGMDLWSRSLYAIRVDLGVAVASVAIAMVVGGALGGLIGYLGGWLDEISMRMVDVMQSFPAFVLALAVATLLGRGIVDLIAVIALVSTLSYIRRDAKRGALRRASSATSRPPAAPGSRAGRSCSGTWSRTRSARCS